jgi:hypothetical protein
LALQNPRWAESDWVESGAPLQVLKFFEAAKNLFRAARRSLWECPHDTTLTEFGKQEVFLTAAKDGFMAFRNVT